jgi:hypothetical protein
MAEVRGRYSIWGTELGGDKKYERAEKPLMTAWKPLRRELMSFVLPDVCREKWLIWEMNMIIESVQQVKNQDGASSADNE